MDGAGAKAELKAGWPILLACGFGVGVGLTGLPYYTFGTFLKPLAADFGWTRSEVSLAGFFLQLGIVLTSPFLGRFIDRHGARPVALGSLLGLATGLVAVGFSGPSLISFYFAWIGLALLGCGTTPLSWTQMVNLRFDKARGIALGLVLCGTGIASVLAPRACAALIAAFGWRGGYFGLAGFVVAIALPVVWFGTRGMAHKVRTAERPRSGLTLREAAGRRQFWMIAGGIFAVMLVQAAAMVHLVPLLTDRGFSPGDATAAAGLMGVAVIFGRLIVGSLVDRFHAPYVASCFLPMPALALALLAVSGSTTTTLLAILLIGLAAGAEVDLLAYLTSRYFGMRHYGAIYGAKLSFFSLGAGIGPALAGWSFDHNGSYDMALWSGAALVLIGAALIGVLGPYPRPEQLRSIMDA
ncbi:putative MFS family arabinose efflux permease [Sphingomonas zeicaulis]|uniref:MFS transporter n=1 Tax=Sphingomonas zeicaulis TaxID=1632740 RepID=UPI003D262028